MIALAFSVISACAITAVLFLLSAEFFEKFGESSGQAWGVFIVGVVLMAAFFVAFFFFGQEMALKNKICPQCYSTYSPTTSFCKNDGEKLDFIVPQEEE